MTFHYCKTEAAASPQPHKHVVFLSVKLFSGVIDPGSQNVSISWQIVGTLVFTRTHESRPESRAHTICKVHQEHQIFSISCQLGKKKKSPRTISPDSLPVFAAFLCTVEALPASCWSDSVVKHRGDIFSAGFCGHGRTWVITKIPMRSSLTAGETRKRN